MNNNEGRQHNHPWKLTLLVALGILFILGISLNCQLTRPVINPPTGTATASPTASSTYTPTITRTPTPTQPPPTSTLGNINPSELFTLGRGSISDVTRSPDGRLVAVLENGYLKWFSSETYEQLGEIFVDEYAGGIDF